MQTITPVDSQAQRMLDTVLRDLPEPNKPNAGCFDTVGRLIFMANHWPNPPDECACRDLHMLCRQIAVSKKVLRYYPVDGCKAVQVEMLPADYWALLIAVLLVYAERDPDDNPFDRGLALKCLNAALQALDIAEDLGNVPHLTMMRTWANHAADCLCSENAR